MGDEVRGGSGLARALWWRIGLAGAVCVHVGWAPGCRGGSGQAEDDAHVEAAVDGGADVGADSSTDALEDTLVRPDGEVERDAGADSTADGGADSAVDGGVDSGADSGADAAADAGSDADGTLDADGEPGLRVSCSVPARLDDDDRESRWVELGVGSGGHAVAAWLEGPSIPGEDIQAAVRDPSTGLWSAPTTLGPFADDRHAVAVDGEGNAWLAWGAAEDGPRDGFRARYDAESRTWSTPESFAASVSPAMGLAFTPEGDAVLNWNERDETDSMRAMSAFWNATEETWSEPAEMALGVDPGTCRPVEMSSTGLGVAVCWADSTRVVQLYRDGAWLAEPVDYGAVNADTYISVAFRPGELAQVTWRSMDTREAFSRALSLDETGAAVLGEVEPLGVLVAELSGMDSIADGHDRMMLLFSHYRITESSNIQWMRRTALGSWTDYSGITRRDSGSGINSTGHVLGATAFGDVLAVYWHSAGDFTPAGLRLRLYDVAADSWQPAVDLEAESGLPSLVPLGGDAFLIGYQAQDESAVYEAHAVVCTVER